MIGVILTFGRRVPFRSIVEGERFSYLHEVWIKEKPFRNGSGKWVNAMKEDFSGSGTVQDDESAWISDDILVIQLEE